VRAFQLIRIGLTGHIYYISFVQGQLIGHEIECEDADCDCSRTLRATPVCIRDNRNLEVLIEITFPTVREVYAKRLEFEADLAKNLAALHRKPPQPAHGAVHGVEPNRRTIFQRDAHG